MIGRPERRRVIRLLFYFKRRSHVYYHYYYGEEIREYKRSGRGQWECTKTLVRESEGTTPLETHRHI
jgi:hypothetical protein